MKTMMMKNQFKFQIAAFILATSCLFCFVDCQQQPVCKNGGVLVAQPTPSISQLCICPKDFIGPNCETRLGDLSSQQRSSIYGCALRPCWIGSTCEDRNSSFVCHCSAVRAHLSYLFIMNYYFIYLFK